MATVLYMTIAPDLASIAWSSTGHLPPVIAVPGHDATILDCSPSPRSARTYPATTSTAVRARARNHPRVFHRRLGRAPSEVIDVGLDRLRAAFFAGTQRKCAARVMDSYRVDRVSRMTPRSRVSPADHRDSAGGRHAVEGVDSPVSSRRNAEPGPQPTSVGGRSGILDSNSAGAAGPGARWSRRMTGRGRRATGGRRTVAAPRSGPRRSAPSTRRARRSMRTTTVSADTSCSIRSSGFPDSDMTSTLPAIALPAIVPWRRHHRRTQPNVISMKRRALRGCQAPPADTQPRWRPIPERRAGRARHPPLRARPNIFRVSPVTTSRSRSFASIRCPSCNARCRSVSGNVSSAATQLSPSGSCAAMPRKCRA